MCYFALKVARLAAVLVELERVTVMGLLEALTRSVSAYRIVLYAMDKKPRSKTIGLTGVLSHYCVHFWAL